MHKYCAVTTSDHPLSRNNPECRRSIKRLIREEGGKGTLFKYDEAFNLDLLEKSLADRDGHKRRKTMDAFWGISENGQNRKIALVEFKFNVGNPNNLTRTDLEGKVRDSINIVSTEPPVYNKYYFVFSDNVIQQAISRIHRLFAGKPNNSYSAITEKILHDLFW